MDVQVGTRGKIAVGAGTGFLLDAEPVSSWLPPATPADRLELARPHVLVVNDIISKLGRIETLLDQFATRGKSLAIIARGASGAAKEMLVVNGRLPGATLTALQPTAAGVGALAALEDVAVATGALVIGEATGTSLDTIRPPMLGRAQRLVFSRQIAIFDRPAGARDAVSACSSAKRMSASAILRWTGSGSRAGRPACREDGLKYGLPDLPNETLSAAWWPPGPR